MSRRWTWFVMLGLLVVLSACGGAKATPAGGPPTQAISRAVTPTPAPPTPTPEPTNTPTPTPVPPTPTPTPTFTAAPERAVEFIPVEQAAHIQDVRLRMRVKITGEIEELQSYGDTPVMEWLLEITRNPPAKRLVMKGLMAEMMGEQQGEEGALEFIQVGDQMWMKMGGVWIMATSPDVESTNPEEALYDYLGTFSPGDWKEVGRETIAGVETTHYRLEVDATGMAGMVGLGFLPTLLQRLGKEASVDAQIVRFVSDVYATDEGVILKASYSLSFQITEDGKAVPVTETLEYEVEGINLGLVIEPPQVEVAPAPVPLPEAAQLSMSMGNMQVYTVSNMTVQEVVAFYEERLPQEGFAIEFKTVSPDQGGMWRISREGKTYTLMVGPSGAGEVAITIQAE